MHLNRVRLFLFAATVFLGGCSDQIDQAKNAAEAAAELAKMAKKSDSADKKVEAAQEAAAKEAAKNIPKGATAEEAKQHIDMAKGIAGMEAMAKEMGGGPVVNWRQLLPFLPEKIAGFKAKGEVDGATNKVGGLENTQVNRRYESGEKRLQISIVDTSMMGMLRAPFAMIAMVSEDSSKGYKKGKEIDGYKSIVEWKKKSRRSHVTSLVGDRFIVNVQVDGGDEPDAAEKIVGKLDLAKIAKLKAKN
jgi:hypothetical protein